MHTARRISDLPNSGIQTCGTTLGATRILKFAREPLTLAPAAGRKNEDPVGEKHRRQQRAEPLQQLPTCTHIAFLEFSGRVSRRGPHATRYANGKQARTHDRTDSLILGARRTLWRFMSP